MVMWVLFFFSIFFFDYRCWKRELNYYYYYYYYYYRDISIHNWILLFHIILHHHMFFYMYHNEITKDIYIYIFAISFRSFIFWEISLYCKTFSYPIKNDQKFILECLEKELEYLKYYSIPNFYLSNSNKLYLNGKLEY